MLLLQEGCEQIVHDPPRARFKIIYGRYIHVTQQYNVGWQNDSAAVNEEVR